jgi:hypothetical protein
MTQTKLIKNRISKKAASFTEQKPKFDLAKMAAEMPEDYTPSEEIC